MDIKEIIREKILVEMLAERDQMIVELFNEIQKLRAEIEKMNKAKKEA